MNCPKCKTLIKTFCKEKCSFIHTNLNRQIVSYEIRQDINENNYLLDGGFDYTCIFQIIKIPMFEPPLNENQEQRYETEYKKVFYLSYFYLWKSQEELESMIPRLLNLKAFL